MKDFFSKLNVSVCDAIVLGGEIHVVKNCNDHVVSIAAMHGRNEPISLTHFELADIIDRGKCSIEYGYFESRQVARRARAGRSLLTRLSQKSRLDAFWWETWCAVMLEAEAEGLFNRSSKRWAEFLPLLEERVTESLKKGLAKATPGAVFDTVAIRRSPSRTSAMKHLREWEKSKDPMVFVKKSIFNGSNAKRVHAEVEAIIQRELESYNHPGEIFACQVHHAVNAEVRSSNKVRVLAGDTPLPEVSESTIERRINELDKFEVLAARKGLAVAKNKLGAHGGGSKLHAPLYWVQMDEWEIDLMAILKKAGIDFTQQSLRDLEIGRYYVCVAFDTATRSILGLNLSEKQSSDDAKAVLWMAMRDKTAIARNLKCETSWKQHGHIYHVAVDNGAAFVNVEFKSALSDLGIDYSVLPAGVPKLRGHIERVFGTVAKILMPYLTGRTFGSIEERGDYPSEKYVVHTAESIIEILVRFVVDVYHNRKHRGLEYSTPNLAWDRLISEYGWSPAMSNHTLRSILGVKLKRKTGRHGILMNGVKYHSKKLAKHFQKFGQQNVEVSVDPEDMGYISVWLENGKDSGWATLKALKEGLDGVSFAAWEHTIFELRQSNRRAAALTQGVVDRAIKRIKEIDAEQCAVRQLGPIKLTQKQIERAQKETFWGLSLGEDPEAVIGNPSDEKDDYIGLMEDEIPLRPDPLPEEKPVLPNSQDRSPEFWSFSDEIEEPLEDEGEPKNSDENGGDNE